MVWLRQKRDPRGKFARWLLELEAINYVVKYRRGVDNLAADYLSRSATTYDEKVNDEIENLERHVYPIHVPAIDDIYRVNDVGCRGEGNDFMIHLESASFSKRLIDAQKLDQVTAGAISQIKENGSVTYGQCKKFKEMKIRNGILFRRSRMVILCSMTDQVIDIIHRNSHWGVQRTFEETRRRCYWRGLFRDVERFCSTCEVCMKNKRANIRRQPLVPIKLQYNFPRAMVSFDIATLPWASGGYRYVLLMTDLFAKFIEAVPMRNQEASSVLKALEQGWFLRHGYPLVLLSDQGRNVDGSLIYRLCATLGISKLRSSPYHPQRDGQAERSVQSFKQALRCLLEERNIGETDWPSLVQEVTFACNSYVNASTGYSPNEIMYAASLRTKADAIFPGIKPISFKDIQSYCEHVEEARKVVHERVHENVMNSQRRMEKNYNRGTKDSEVDSGDWVWLRNEARQHSLSPMFRGPWLVIERRGVSLQLADSEGAKLNLCT